MSNDKFLIDDLRYIYIYTRIIVNFLDVLGVFSFIVFMEK